MKVLFLHNTYLIGGGEDVSTQLEIELLRQHDHEVEVILVSNESLSGRNYLQMALDAIWSRRFYRLLLAKIEAGNFDIIHVQNFFPQISPSVFFAARKKGTRIVMSVRNYRLVCPNALLYVHHEICTKCIGKTIPYPALLKKCYRDSFGATATAVAMLATHNMLQTWKYKVDGFIAVSDFVHRQLELGGINPDKIFTRYNYVPETPEPVALKGDHFLYVGRLSVEKGISVMLDSFNSPELRHQKLRIIGTGPLLAQVESAAAANPNIIYLGSLPYSEASQEMSQAKCLIFPSQWHEPFGRTIIESFSVGTPVIGSRQGGVTELITDGLNGFTYEAANSQHLVETILKFNDVSNQADLPGNARRSYLERFTAAKSYSRVMEIYQEVLHADNKQVIEPTCR